MKQTDDFDGILNDALAEYREAEPLAGIEERVLRRVQTRTAQPRFAWRWLTASALALLALLVWFGVRHSRFRRAEPQVVQHTAPQLAVQPQTAQVGNAENHAPHAAPERRARKNGGQREASRRITFDVARVPVRSEFPSPEPLDRRELALLALARTDPVSLQSLVRDENSKDIPPITIRPLEQDSATQGEN